MPDDDPRVSDEATGLPPLEVVDPEDTLLVLAWDASVGVAMSPHTKETVAVRYLHIRGLTVPNDAEKAGGAEATWAQLHLAVPVEHAVDVAAALAMGATEIDPS